MNHQKIENRPKRIRLDQYVANHLTTVSRAFAAKLIGLGKVTINGMVVAKLSHKVNNQDKVAIDYDPTKPMVYESIELPVIYEDSDCVVINKPTGILSHSKGAFNPEATVASWLSNRLNGLSGERAGIVHRLDRGTSGVMICAKNEAASKWLQKQFSSRKVKKTYIAIVSGQLKDKQAIIDMPIERNPKKPQTFRVGVNGKPASTSYRVLSSNSKYSLVELNPATGRTHQLRVHLSSLGHSIIGDNLYNGAPADRLYLHALSLELTLPSRARQTFKAELPKQFNNLIKNNG